MRVEWAEMIGNESEAASVEPQTIKGSIGKAILFLFISLGFVLIGGSEIASKGTSADIRAWLGVIFFGFGAIVFAVLLFRPMTIALDANGFTVTGGLIRSPKITRWRDIQGFFVYKLPRGSKMVGYNYVPGSPARPKMANFSRLVGAEAALPKGFAGSAEKLAETLNEYRERALVPPAASLTVPKFGRRTTFGP